MSESDRQHETANAGRPLSADQAAQVAEQLAELTAMGAPLAEGLRAAADETTSRRLQRVFTAMAARLEAGEPLETVLAERSAALPPHITGLVQAGLRCGQLSQVLTELVERQRTIRELRRGVWMAACYPLFLIVVVVAMFVFAFAAIIPSFGDLYDDLDTQLPRMTQAVLDVSKHITAAVDWVAGLWASWTNRSGLITLATIGVTLLAVRWWVGRQPWFERLRAGWHWFLSTMPIVGPLRLDIMVSDFARLLRVLLQQQVPLPDALKLTAAGLDDAHVAAVSRDLAEDTAAGQSLSDALQASSRMPAQLVPLIRWGERTGRLPDALATIRDMFEERVRLGTGVLTSILPPLAFIIVGGAILGLLASIALPLVPVVGPLS